MIAAVERRSQEDKQRSQEDKQFVHCTLRCRGLTLHGYYESRYHPFLD